MKPKSEFLTKSEIALLEEILRLKNALRVNDIVLTGAQLRALRVAMGRKQYAETYEKRLRGVVFTSTEARRRYTRRSVQAMDL